MHKQELLQWLTEEQQKWELLLAAIGESRMDQAGVSGDWSMRDVIVHLTGWQHWVVARLQAAAAGQPEPSPPWPADRTTDDAVNAWIDAAYRQQSLRQVLDDTRAVHQQLMAVIEQLPADCRIETIDGKFHVIWLHEQRFVPGEFFYHFYDDHAADVRAWLERTA